MNPSHLFLSSSGDLFDTRRPDWANRPIRPGFSRTHREINNSRELCATLRAGGRAWPGGYPIVLITADGEMVSIPAILQNRSALRIMLRDTRDANYSRIVGADIYYEGPIAQCVYTGADIESAYGDPEGETE